MTLQQNTGSDPVREYAEAVLSGAEIAGPHVRASCQRHLDDLANGHERGLWFDHDAADRALSFFPDILRLNGGQFEGVPFNLHPSQAFIIGSLFGWKMKSGVRRFRAAYVEEGKGNGKSPKAGGIGLYMMLADHEPGAQIYAAATKTDQARILFDDAVKMVHQSPALARALTLSGSNPVHTITHKPTSSFFRPISKESGKTGSGPRPHCGLIDELHEHPNRDIVEMIERGFKFRQNPLLFLITNSGSDRGSYCYEWHETAVSAAHRSHDPADLGAMDRIFSYVCSLDEGDDPLWIGPNGELPVDVWKKANPLLGTILTEEYLAGVAADARAVPGKANGIRRLHFCQWTDAQDAWMSVETWAAREDDAMRLEDFEGKKVWIGLDLGATRDLTGVGLAFEDGIDGEGRERHALFSHGFTPADTLSERVKRDKTRYDVWVDQEHITATPGKYVRFDYVAQYLVDLSHRFDVQAIAYDKWMIRKLEEELDLLGVTLPLVEHPQGFNRRKDSNLAMPDSIDRFEEALLDGRIRIAPNPALRSSVTSSVFDTSPSGQRRFEKRKATSRIDLAVASAMAIGAASEDASNATSSSYLEEEELLVL